MEGIKHDHGKPRMDLLPPEALLEVSKVFAYGAGKYADNNYRLGMKHSRIVAALMRHLMLYQMGCENDESGLPHLAHMACNALMLLTLSLTGKGEDDRWVENKDSTIYDR